MFFSKIFKSKLFLFFVLAIISFYFYDFQKYFFLQPQGFHFSRQTDSLSFIYNYIENGFNFLNISNYNLNSFEGRAASEFPVFHYFYAIIIKLFKSDYSLIRILNLTLVYTSLYYLYKTIDLFINNQFSSLVLTFLFFSSTILIHYSCNFLPDVNSVALCFIGNYFAILFFKINKFEDFLKASLFLTLSILIKPSYIIYIISFYTISFYYNLKLKHFATITLCFVLILFWILYIKYYNAIYHQYYYLTKLKPIWNCTTNEINDVIDFVLNYWYTKYYYQSTFHLFFAIILFSPYIVIKNYKNNYTKYVILLICGILLYFLLFFKQFKDHDYYFITMIPAISIIITFFYARLKELIQIKWISDFTIFLIVLITILSINYSKEKLIDRYQKSFISGAIIGYELQGCDKYLDSIHIDKNQKFLVLGDETPNGSLFFIKRKGWTVANLEGENEAYFKVQLLKTNYLIITAQQMRYFNKKSYICYDAQDIIKFRNNIIIKIR